MKEEASDIQRCLQSILPELSLEASIFRPTWVIKDGVRYQNNNAYVVIHFDGLDPVFGRLDELLVVGGSTIIFHTTDCKVLYFDDHYHAYVISMTAKQSFHCNIRDHNVYHAHVLRDKLTYISLKYCIFE